MDKLKPPHDPIEALGEAYELLLEKSLAAARKAEEKGEAGLHHFIDETKNDVAELKELGREEMNIVAEYLKRDLSDAADYLDKTGKELKDWFDFDMALIKDRLLEMFSQAADQTTKELMELKFRAAASEYHTGEMTGPGTLLCDKCAEKLHFHNPGHIPPCPKCRGTHFHREKIE
jgi:glycosidase